MAGTFPAAGETRLSAGINLGWSRIDGLSLNLAASWPLEAIADPIIGSHDAQGRSLEVRGFSAPVGAFPGLFP